MKQRKPWEIKKELTKDRITEIGQLIYKARWEVLADESIRDNAWGLGCRSYSWCMHDISELSKLNDYDWLEIVNPSLKFIFSIEGIHISFYKGDPNAPKKNIYNRAQAFPELRQSELFQEEPLLSPNIVWTYAVESGFDGHTTNISFQGITDNNVIIASHVIQIDDIDMISDTHNPPLNQEIDGAPVEVESVKPRLRDRKITEKKNKKNE